MSRQIVCKDCGRVFNSWPELKKHAARHVWGHRKAKRQIRQHDAAAKKTARRQHPTIRQANQGRQRNKLDGLANNPTRQPRPGRPVGVRYARQVRDLEHDRYWEN